MWDGYFENIVFFLHAWVTSVLKAGLLKAATCYNLKRTRGTVCQPDGFPAELAGHCQPEIDKSHTAVGNSGNRK